jgi:hypothetical protein
MAQMLLTQVAVALGKEQTAPQVPQFFGSELVLTQTPLQVVCPAGQDWQVPLTQVCPLGQDAPLSTTPSQSSSSPLHVSA